MTPSPASHRPHKGNRLLGDRIIRAAAAATVVGLPASRARSRIRTCGTGCAARRARLEGARVPALGRRHRDRRLAGSAAPPPRRQPRGRAAVGGVGGRHLSEPGCQRRGWGQRSDRARGRRLAGPRAPRRHQAALRPARQRHRHRFVDAARPVAVSSDGPTMAAPDRPVPDDGGLPVRAVRDAKRTVGHRRTTGRRPGPRSGSARRRTDGPDLEDAARTAFANLSASGQRLTRDRLTQALRSDGHSVSNARAGELLSMLRAPSPPRIDRSPRSDCRPAEPLGVWQGRASDDVGPAGKLDEPAHASPV